MKWVLLLGLFLQQDGFINAPIHEGHTSEYCNLTKWYAPTECRLFLYLDDGEESAAIKQLLGTDFSEYRKHENKGTREYNQANFLLDEINATGRLVKVVVKHETDSDVRRDIEYPAFGFHRHGEIWQFHYAKSCDMFILAMELHHIAQLRHIVFEIVQNGTDWKRKPFDLDDGVPILHWKKSESRDKQDDWNVHIENYDLVTRGPMGPPNHRPTRTVTQTWTRTIINEVGLEERQELTKNYTIPGNTPVSTLILYTDHGTGQLIDYYLARLLREGRILMPLPLNIP